MAKYIFLFFLVFLLAGKAAIAQTENVEVVEAPVADEEYEEINEVPEVRDTFLFAHPVAASADTLNGIKRNKKFAYIKNLDSLLKANQKKEEDQLKKNTNTASEPVKPKRRSFMDRVLGNGVFQSILWILAACFVLVIIYQLVKGNGIFQKNTTNTAIKEVADEEQELMQQDNFDVLINKAIADKNYRLAVRYHFIQVLQTLRSKNHIQYEADKTNSQYVYETPQHFRNDFSRLIFQYEYVWYGHFEINEEQYQRVKEGFYDFNKKI